ncbi:MAG TPA: ABC transporter permease [Thermoanaerobaculia bacterium]|nr:ABC transporter permease [Thermoanaerobaculia bacterium]
MSSKRQRRREDSLLPLRGIDAAVWRLARRVAPPDHRTRFVREWSGEIAHLAKRDCGRRPSWRTVALAALADAWWLRRHRGAEAPGLASRLLDAGPCPIAAPSPASGPPSIAGPTILHRIALAVRLGRRRIVRSPLFSTLFVLLLATGVAAAATVYTLAHEVVFAPLAYDQPERLVRLLLRDPDGKLDWTSWGQFERLGASDVFESIAASTTFPGTWRSPEGLERIQRSFVSASYFETLGVSASLGRLLGSDSGEARNGGGQDQVVLADGFWRQRMAADETALGATIEVDGRPRTVIGIAPPELYGHDLGNEAPQLYLLQPAAQVARSPHFRVFTLLARLGEGQDAAAAAAELERATAGLAEDRPETYGGWRAEVEPLREALLGDAGRSLRLLLWAVVALLLLVTLDLAGLMASRALSRARESALHQAIGAGHGAAAVHALIEGPMLCLLGGVLGIALTGLALAAILRAGPALPRLGEIAWGAPTVVFALLAALGSSLVVAVATLLLAHSRQPFLALRTGARSGSPHGAALRSLLISTQIAIAVPLVLGACLLLRNLLELRGRELGLEPDGVYSLRVSRAPERSTDRADNARLFAELVERVGALPGTGAAGASLYTPLLTEEADRTRFQVQGEPHRTQDDAPRALMQISSPGFLETLRTRVVAGRDFDSRDHLDAPPVALVNRELVRRAFSDQSPLGRRLELELSLIPGDPPVREIVGVVEDQAQLGPLARPEPMVYLPHAQTPWPSMALVLRSSLDPEALQPALRAAVLELDSDAIVEPAIGLGSAFESTLARPRGLAHLLLAFAVAATLVSALGLYAALSMQVAQRGQEIGLRMALGATRRDVARLFLARGATITAAGLAPGILLALGLRRVLSAQLHGVGAADPLAVGATLGTLLLTGLLASWLPAQRAARHDPRRSLQDGAG